MINFCFKLCMFFLSCFSLGYAGYAHAQIKNSEGVIEFFVDSNKVAEISNQGDLITTGAIKLPTVLDACTMTNMGVLAYDFDIKNAKFCNGISWIFIDAEAIVNEPDAFTFQVWRTGDARDGIVAQSNDVSVTGFTGSLVVSIATPLFQNTGTLVVNGVPSSTSSTVIAGDTISLRAAPPIEDALTYTVTLGTYSTDWAINTLSLGGGPIILFP